MARARRAHHQPVSRRRRRRRLHASHRGEAHACAGTEFLRREHGRRRRHGRSCRDGYTFFVGAIHHTIAESIYSKLTYNIERDFEPVTVLAYVPNVIVIHPKHAGIRTYGDFLAYAKANPGKLN